MAAIFLNRAMQGFLILLVSFSLVGCGRLFYWPETELRGTPEQLDMPHRDVFLENEAGNTLHGW
ncbi:hypothetical protein [Marinospirillum celere]|uniref:hypothetical protein n=1 Tax=Marinospirillum celere TaxID=1122252 RepID=UPI000B88319B|nr:hypothetical protein [Marinospirillum celere]